MGDHVGIPGVVLLLVFLAHSTNAFCIFSTECEFAGVRFRLRPGHLTTYYSTLFYSTFGYSLTYTVTFTFAAPTYLYSHCVRFFRSRSTGSSGREASAHQRVVFVSSEQWFLHRLPPPFSAPLCRAFQPAWGLALVFCCAGRDGCKPFDYKYLYK